MNVFTPEEVADLWKVPIPDVTKEIECGALAAFKVGGNIRITDEAIREFVQRPLHSYSVQVVGTGSGGLGAIPGSSKSRVRSGNLEYQYFDGFWLGARPLLEALERDHHPYATSHQQAFQTVLRGSGNGLSNLAKHAAKKLGLQSREKR
jgi:hypothetical protein